MGIENLEGKFSYKPGVDGSRIKFMLGLDGGMPTPLKPWEKERLATLLRREDRLTDKEVRELGMRVVPSRSQGVEEGFHSKQEIIKGSCKTHGEDVYLIWDEDLQKRVCGFCQSSGLVWTQEDCPAAGQTDR